jgi:hypothetical protein
VVAVRGPVVAAVLGVKADAFHLERLRHVVGQPDVDGIVGLGPEVELDRRHGKLVGGETLLDGDPVLCDRHHVVEVAVGSLCHARTVPPPPA